MNFMNELSKYYDFPTEMFPRDSNLKILKSLVRDACIYLRIPAQKKVKFNDITRFHVRDQRGNQQINEVNFLP